MTDAVTALKDDFKLFLQALWEELDLPSPTRAQYSIADYLQHGPKRLQIQAFRGVGKSWITGAFVLWTLFKDPEKKIMIISASKERADNMSIFLQKLIIETSWLKHLRPKSEDSRWSRISFDVLCSPHQAPSVKSVGIPGVMYKGYGKDPAVRELLKKLKKDAADSLDSSGMGTRWKV